MKTPSTQSIQLTSQIEELFIESFQLNMSLYQLYLIRHRCQDIGYTEDDIASVSTELLRIGIVLKDLHKDKHYLVNTIKHL